MHRVSQGGTIPTVISECSTQQRSQKQTQATTVTAQQQAAVSAQSSPRHLEALRVLLTFGGCPSSPLWSSSYPDVCLCIALEQRPHKQDIPLKAREKEFTGVDGTAKSQCFPLRNSQLGQQQNTPVLSSYCTVTFEFSEQEQITPNPLTAGVSQILSDQLLLEIISM